VHIKQKKEQKGKKAKGPEWLMSNNDKEKSLGFYLTIETIGYEKKPPSCQL
jgi:hypothetical protein